MQLKTLLILLVSSLLAFSCKKTGLGDMPDLDAPEVMYEIDLSHKACGQYKLVGLDPISYKAGDDLPLSSCDGVVGLKIQRVQKLLSQIRELQAWKNQKLKEAGL